MKKSILVGVLLTVFIVMPIWFYLLHEILEYIKASELLWFLYWIYVPVNLLCAILIKISED